MRILAAVSGLCLMLAACDALPRIGRSNEAEPRLSLSMGVSHELDWGAVSTIQLTLTNRSEAASPKTHVQLYLPAWLEFASVEPESTEVTLLRAGSETRLMYRLGDPPLQPGESRMVLQRVRVPPRQDAAAMRAAGDSIALRRAPTDRVLRARIVSPDGEELGAEVQTVMPFRGAENAAIAPSGAGAVISTDDAVIERDRVGPIRLGASVADVRTAVPDARDTTFIVGEGEQERGVAVPLAGGARVLVMVVNDRIDRIIVRDPRLHTARGLGVGSTIQQLRQAYGRSCFAPAAAGGTAVWFPDFPGISFAFQGRPARAAADTAGGRTVLPDTAQVRELWVRRGIDTC